MEQGQLEAHIDRLVQERRNSSALAMELRLSCTNPSIYSWNCGTVNIFYSSFVTCWDDDLQMKIVKSVL